MLYTLKNDSLSLTLNDFGAELTSILDSKTNTEYLWNADPDYWKRHSPILFPFVGSLKNKSYTFQGKTYPSSQHGFARDMNFQLLRQSEDAIWFFLEATKETREIYPFNFRLELGYQLQDRKITVFWRVQNIGNSVMYFSIGGHPAFNCPLNPEEKQIDYSFAFDTTEPISYLQIDQSGLLHKEPKHLQKTLQTVSGILPVDHHLFDNDALIIEDHQCHQVSLLLPSKKPYLTVTFSAPLFGLWSPAGKNAPFVCIEPWYGRCDASDFNGTLQEREWGNSLEAGKIFGTSYCIEIA